MRFDAEGGGTAEPRDADGYSRALASAVNDLLASPERRLAMGKAARARVLREFSWGQIASVTLDFYRELLARAPRR